MFNKYKILSEKSLVKIIGGKAYRLQGFIEDWRKMFPYWKKR